jgi:hypothetical protein
MRFLPFSDEEAYEATQSVFEDKGFVKGMYEYLPKELVDYFLKTKDEIHSIFDFQSKMTHIFLAAIEKKSLTGRTSSGFEALNKGDKYLYFSNHRDIVLDNAFMNNILYEHGVDTCQFAIGSNLMKHSIADYLFRLNKSFVVMREGTPRELYANSVNLSKHIATQINEKNTSIWIAQREGRAKDGNDRTQVSLLKMLTMSNKGNMVDFFKALKIVPVSVSYEFDPCDILKTQEFISKRNDPNYKKSFEQDLQSMLWGLMGNKGHLHFHFDQPLDDELESVHTIDNKKEQLEMLAKIIDKSIHRNFRLHPVNYVAYDLKQQTNSFLDKQYSAADWDKYSKMFADKMKNLKIKEEDARLANDYLLGIYANPVINALKAAD